MTVIRRCANATSTSVSLVGLCRKNAYVDTFEAFAHVRHSTAAASSRPPIRELHARPEQHELQRVQAVLGIGTETWSPLGQGYLLSNPTVTAVADTQGKTPAQVLIRWHIQLGNIVFPKSVTPERIVSNLNVFEFELSEQEMESISSLGDGTRPGPDPRTFNSTG
jgi:2,5-diketo-D-gluconate reductase A